MISLWLPQLLCFVFHGGLWNGRFDTIDIVNVYARLILPKLFFLKFQSWRYIINSLIRNI